MDINCPICGEPWDLGELHEVYEDGPPAPLLSNKVSRPVKVPYATALKRFRVEGCAVFGTTHNSEPDKPRAEISALLFDILGDDVDGVAASMEDFEQGYL